MQILLFLYNILLISTPIAVIILALWLRKRAHAKNSKPKWYHALFAVLLTPSIIVYPIGGFVTYYRSYYDDPAGGSGMLAAFFLFALLVYSAVFYAVALLSKPKSFFSIISLAVFITFILMSILLLSDGAIDFDKVEIIRWLVAFGTACFSGSIYWLYMRDFYKEEPPN